MVTIEQLNAAAQRFYARSDDFAIGKGAICEDLARKLARFGSFASDKQADFAAKLVTWSEPRPRNNAPAVSLPTHLFPGNGQGHELALGRLQGGFIPVWRRRDCGACIWPWNLRSD
jgi:hypothetical protein